MLSTLRELVLGVQSMHSLYSENVVVGGVGTEHKGEWGKHKLCMRRFFSHRRISLYKFCNSLAVRVVMSFASVTLKTNSAQHFEPGKSLHS